MIGQVDKGSAEKKGNKRLWMASLIGCSQP